MEHDLLRNAESEAKRHGLDRQLVIDADVHHLAVAQYLGPYADEPWRSSLQTAGPDRLLPTVVGDRGMAGRIRRPAYAGYGPRGVSGMDATPPDPSATWW